MMKGKTIVLGVTGSIAAYKIAGLASSLMKEGCEVHVVMTRNATNFINPITFETLTGNKCLVDTFDRNFEFHVAHVSLAKKADVILVAPATANIIGKMACGIADDMLSTVILAAQCPVIVSPAMNTNMFRNSIVQENLQKLERHGMEIIPPQVGRLACADVGEGKMPDEAVLMAYIRKAVAYEKDLKGLKVLVTAGPTQEAIDPVRFISNHSTGKMGFAVARAAMERGAEVTLVCGPTTVEPPLLVNVVRIRSAAEMHDAVVARFAQCDMLIKSAAVADFTPAEYHDEKVKKKDGEMALPLKRTTDILREVGALKQAGQLICGFSMETENLVENSRKKLTEKHLDLVVANNLKVEGAGFGVDTNVVTLISPKETEQLPMLSKEEVAHRILDQLLKQRNSL
ncbi:MAG: bifunctional phosphopantothenoylcysteine decarboxylase/phosphopantothenate--cysteine ligase CoaBC [Bacteroidales bacterium]|nr:bifunctional phosphopantothenoylcysteine decarboxylase/phosphopantothenate--cysteine ligase CoaBC [Bacteroidales bacterium]